MQTTPASPHRSTQAVRISFMLGALLVSAAILFMFVQVSGVNKTYKARFDDMINGAAPRPFVYRVLLPISVRTISAATPTELKLALEPYTQHPLLQNLLRDFVVPPQMWFEGFVALGLLYLSLVGFTIALRYLLTGLYHTTPLIADVVPLFGTLGLVPFFQFGHLYDFPTLFLGTLALALLVRARWISYSVVFLLACINKEMALVLTAVFVLYYWRRLPWPRFAGLLAVQLAIFGVVKGALTWIFRTNPGSVVEFNLAKHLDVYSTFPLYTVLQFLCVGLVLLLACAAWPHKPLFLRRAMLLMPPMFGLYLFLGWPFEWRAFYELYPILALLIAQTLVYARYGFGSHAIRPRLSQ